MKESQWWCNQKVTYSTCRLRRPAGASRRTETWRAERWKRRWAWTRLATHRLSAYLWTSDLIDLTLRYVTFVQFYIQYIYYRSSCKQKSTQVFSRRVTKTWYKESHMKPVFFQLLHTDDESNFQMHSNWQHRIRDWWICEWIIEFTSLPWNPRVKSRGVFSGGRSCFVCSTLTVK